MKKDALILVRGGGDLATGTIHRLWSAGLRVLVLEAEHPAAIRRQVSLCEAVYEGETAVEGLRAVRIETLAQAEEVWKQNAVPVLVDPQGKSIAPAKPDVLVDAILAKKNLGTTRDMAPLTIALGPGFTAGQDVDVVVETKRGHRLGRIIREGSAIPDTGIPGIIGGYGKERVIHAGTAGIFMDLRKIGDIVEAGETIAQIRTADGAMISVTTQITGILRGLLRSSYPVTPGFKVADIDPRKEELSNCFLISDKARCIAGSVLELVCAQLWKYTCKKQNPPLPGGSTDREAEVSIFHFSCGNSGPGLPASPHTGAGLPPNCGSRSRRMHRASSDRSSELSEYRCHP